MGIKYDEYDLLEFFEEEPVKINNYIYCYSKVDAYDIKLEMQIHKMARNCTITVSQTKSKRVIVDFITENVDILKCEVTQGHFKDVLKIMRNQEEVLAIIYSIPRFKVIVDQEGEY
jgi:translation initiation factor IF-2